MLENCSLFLSAVFLQQNNHLPPFNTVLCILFPHNLHSSSRHPAWQPLYHPPHVFTVRPQPVQTFSPTDFLLHFGLKVQKNCCIHPSLTFFYLVRTRVISTCSVCVCLHVFVQHLSAHFLGKVEHSSLQKANNPICHHMLPIFRPHRPLWSARVLNSEQGVQSEWLADQVEEEQGLPVIFYSNSPAVCLCLGSATGASWSQKAPLVRSLFIPNLCLLRLGFGSSKRRDEVTKGWAKRSRRGIETEGMDWWRLPRVGDVLPGIKPEINRA